MRLGARSLALFALAAGACGFDPAGGRAGLDPSDAAAGGGDGSPAGPDARPPGTPDGSADGPDAGEPAVEVLVDTLTVPSTGEVVTSIVLDAGVTYRLEASGIAQVSSSGGGFSADAEYFWQDSDPSSVFDGQGGDPPVDVGIAIDDPTVNGTKTPDWGLPTVDHVYSISWPGEDAAIDAQFHDRNFTNNSGDYTVKIFAPLI